MYKIQVRVDHYWHSCTFYFTVLLFLDIWKGWDIKWIGLWWEQQIFWGLQIRRDDGIREKWDEQKRIRCEDIPFGVLHNYNQIEIHPCQWWYNSTSEIQFHYRKWCQIVDAQWKMWLLLQYVSVINPGWISGLSYLILSLGNTSTCSI